MWYQKDKALSNQNISSQNYQRSSSKNVIEPEQLNSFLARQNNLLENLIQIYKQFIKLDTSQEGYVELNKKLCTIESIKFYVEHLSLFNRFELLVAPQPPILTTESLSPLMSPQKNYLGDMEINFRIIENRWRQRRNEQALELTSTSSSTATASSGTNTDISYPFTYLVDCLLEECGLYANVSKFLGSRCSLKRTRSNEMTNFFGSYPPKSIIV